MLYNLVSLVDVADELIYVVIREDDYFKIVPANTTHMTEDLLAKMYDIGSTSEGPGWTSVFLENDRDIQLIATELSKPEVIATLKMCSLLE